MSIKMRMIGLGITLAALGVCATMAAQTPPNSGGARSRNFMGGFGGIGLLRAEKVQKELKLSDEQKTKLQELSERIRSQFRERFSGTDNLSQEERRKRFEEIRQQMQADSQRRLEAMRKEIATILQPEQLKRWRQIELQQEGPTALLRPEVAESVGVTEDQKTKIEEINKETQDKLQSLFQDIRGGDPQTREERMSQLREKAKKVRTEGDGKAMALLNPEQKKKLVEMMGEPFEMERITPMPRRGGDWGLRSRGSRNNAANTGVAGSGATKDSGNTESSGRK